MSHEAENWFYEALGTDWCGNTTVPCDNMSLRWVEMGKQSIASVGNDGFELYLGGPNSWEWTVRREHALKLAWFIIRWRVFGEWLGIRRAIWYWLLHRRCERSNRMAREFRKREREQKK